MSGNAVKRVSRDIVDERDEAYAADLQPFSRFQLAYRQFETDKCYPHLVSILDVETLRTKHVFNGDVTKKTCHAVAVHNLVRTLTHDPRETNY